MGRAPSKAPAARAAPAPAEAKAQASSDAYPLSIARCMVWFKRLCSPESEDYVAVGRFSDSAAVKDVHKMGLSLLKLVGRKFELELGSDGRVNFSKFLAEISWWTAATTAGKLGEAYDLFSEGAGYEGTGTMEASTLVELLASVFPAWRQSTVNDVVVAMLLAAEVHEMHIHGRHKAHAAISRSEFVDWILEFQHSRRFGCDATLLEIEWTAPLTNTYASYSQEKRRESGGSVAPKITIKVEAAEPQNLPDSDTWDGGTQQPRCKKSTDTGSHSERGAAGGNLNRGHAQLRHSAQPHAQRMSNSTRTLSSWPSRRSLQRSDRSRFTGVESNTRRGSHAAQCGSISARHAPI